MSKYSQAVILFFKIRTQKPSAAFIGWFRLKSKSRKTIAINVAKTRVF